MLLGLASLILAILFAFKAYDSSNNGTIAPNASKNIRIVGILIAVSLVLGIVGLVIGYMTVGKSILTTPDKMYQNGMVMVIGVIIMILITVSAFYAWVAYQQSLNTAINTDILIVAIALTIPIFAYLFNLIENYFKDKKELTEFRENLKTKVTALVK
jgi:cation transport ATPase